MAKKSIRLWQATLGVSLRPGRRRMLLHASTGRGEQGIGVDDLPARLHRRVQDF